MGDVFRAGATPCPKDKITVAVLASLQHCGLTYPTSSGLVEICDVRSDFDLRSIPVPDHYYWTAVQLLEHEIEAVAELLEMVLKENPKGFPYSRLYSPDALDVHGKLRSGAGFTCSTYVLAIFDALSLPFVDVATWQTRPEDNDLRDSFLEDRYFKPQRLLASGVLDTVTARTIARAMISDSAAVHIQFEEPDFRVKPDEVCGAATIEKYPVQFKQAINAAKRVARRIKELEKIPLPSPPSATPPATSA
jgi:hypothetical protein